MSETKTEDIVSTCKCNVDLIEGAILINGRKVRYYKCPDCGFFTYHAGDLQKAVYRDAPSSEHKEGGKGEGTRGKGIGTARIATAFCVSIISLVIIFNLPCNCLMKMSISVVLGYYCGYTFLKGLNQLRGK